MMISLSPILLLSLLSSPSRTSHAFTPGAQHHGSQIRSSSSSSTTTRLLNYLDSLSSPSQEGFGGSQIGRPSSGRGGDDPANRPRMDPWSTTTPAPAPATTTNEVTETPVDEKVTPPVVNSNSNNDSPNMVAATPSFAQQLKGDTTTTSTPAATVGENSGPADSKKDPKKTITSKIESSSSSYLDSIERWYKNTLSGSSASRDPMYLDSIEMWYKNTLSGSSTADASYLQTLPSIDPLSGPGTQMSYLDMVNDPPMRVTPETIEAVNAAAAAASNKGTDAASPVTAASVEDAFAALMEAKVRYDTEATQFDPLKPPPSAVQAAKTAAAVSRLQKTINPGNNDDAVTATTTNDATTTTSDQIDAADALAAAVMKLRKEKEELEKSNKDLQSKLTTRSDELMDLEEQVATTRAALTTAKATATVEMKELDATVTALRTEKDDLQVTIGTLKDDVQTAQSDFATLKEKLESTRSQLDGAQRAVAKKKTLDARVLELEAEKEELETQTSTLQVEVTDLSNGLTALQQEVATIQSQVDAAKEEAVAEQAKQEASTKERTAQEETAALERTKTDAAAIEKAKEEAAAVIAQAKEEAAAVTEKAAAAMEKAKEEAAAVVAEAAAVVEKAKKEAAAAIEQARQKVAAAAEKATNEAAAIKKEAAATAKKAAAADAQAKKEAAASEKAEKEAAAAAKAEKEAVIKAQEAAAATEKAEKEAAAAKAKDDAAAAEKAEKEAAVAKAREEAAATEKAEKEVAVAKAKEAAAATEKAEKEAIAVKKAEEEAAAVEEAVKGAIAKAEKEAALVAEKTQKDAAAAATEKVEKKEAAVVAEQTKVEDTFGNTKKGKRARKKAEKAAAAEKAKQEALAKRAEKAAAKQPKPVASKPVVDAPEKEVVMEKTENLPAVSAEESMKAALKLTTLAPESEEPAKIPVKAAATPAAKEAVSSVPMPTQNENVISATPKAKSAAKKAKIDLATITGSGKFGRITAEDVANAMNKKKGRASKILRKEVSPAKMRNDFVPFTSMQRAISKNMVNSLDTPVFRVSLDIETDKLDKVYQRLKRQGVSVSALLAKAVALAIEEHPIINSSYSPDGGVIQHPDINIAMAVAIDGGLATPTIHNANEYDVLEIGKRWRKLVKKAKKGTLTPEEYKGGTFAISNMGMFGVTQFDAILPAGMGGILAIGATRNIMEPDETEFIKAREVHKMNVTLTCDHRQIYGTDAVKFLNTLDDILNNGLHRIWS